MADKPHVGRTSRRFRQLAKQVRARRRPCRICGEPIDYSLRYPHPRSFSVEHIKSWATHPHLREDPANLDAAHLSCNQSKGASEANLARSAERHEQLLGQRSRDW